MNNIGKMVNIEINRFCNEKKYSSAIISIIFMEVLNNRSLDLFKRVEKSDINVAWVFQKRIPNPIYEIYSLLFST